MDEPTRELLDKIIAFYAWSPECLAAIEALARSGHFRETVGALEAVLARSKEGEPLDGEDTGLPDDSCYDLYLKIVGSGPLLRLLQSRPLLSEADPEVVRTFARLSDLTPDPVTILRSSDPVFMDSMRTLTRSGSISAARTILDDFTKLVAFDRQHADIYPLVESLASAGQWTDRIVEIENRLDRPGGAVLLDPAARALYDALTRHEAADRAPLKAGDDFLVEPRFSTMLADEILAYGSVRSTLPAQAQFSKELPDSKSRVEQYRKLAVEAIDGLDPATKQAIDAGLELRQSAALHFFESRKFAKLDALNYTWPQLAKQVRLDGTGMLRMLEGVVIGSDTSTPPEAWQQYLQDQDFVRFVKLRPLFRDIYEDEVTTYFAAMQTVARPSDMGPGSAVAAAPASPVAGAGKGADYKNLFFSIAPGTASGNVAIALTADGKDLGTVEVPETSAEIASIMASLAATNETQLATRNLGVAATRTAASVTVDFQYMGTVVFDTFVGVGAHRQPVISALRTNEPVRILLDVKVPGLRPLPWECLYVSELQGFVGLSRRYSIVRHLPDELSPPNKGSPPGKGSSLGKDSSLSLAPPLRILVASASPKDAPHIEARGEIETLRRALADPIDKRLVELHVLQPATIEKLRSALRRVHPHLFHFIGHGAYDQATRKGALLLEDENGMTALMEAEHLRTHLADSNIALAVLNSCDTGVSAANEVITGVAGALVDRGIPAAIATMRTIVDEAAVMFTREFYRAFVDGYAVEAALIEGRKALSVERWDWPAYALFASRPDLHALRLTSQQRGDEAG